MSNTGSAWTGADAELPHQGRLVDSSGVAFNGTADLEIPIWRHATSTDAGSDRAYTELFADLVLQDGYYAVLLGAGGGLDADELFGPRWVQVSVDGAALLPRTPLSPPGSAITALFDGALRRCDAGGVEAFSAATGWEGCAAKSCQEIYDSAGFAGSDGPYTLDPDGADNGADPFQVTCDFDPANGHGWTLLGDFEGTTHSSLSHVQAQAIPFTHARLFRDDNSQTKDIECYGAATAQGLQTAATDVKCVSSDYHVRFHADGVNTAAYGNYGFYIGALTANDGGCNWSTATNVWGRHHDGSGCEGLGWGEQYVTSNAWGGTRMYLYVR